MTEDELWNGVIDRFEYEILSYEDFFEKSSECLGKYLNEKKKMFNKVKR